jgi:hypothetical protein
MCSADRLYAGFRQAEVLHLALLDEVLHGSRDVFYRNLRIHAVLVEKINHIGLQSLERSLSNLFDVVRPAIQVRPARASRGIGREAKFCGNHNLPADRRQCLTNELFVSEGTIDLRCIEEGDTVFHRRSDQRDHFLFICCRAKTETHSHAAEPKRRNFQIAFSKFAFLHEHRNLRAVLD